jgi:hypothetical protein
MNDLGDTVPLTQSSAFESPLKATTRIQSRRCRLQRRIKTGAVEYSTDSQKALWLQRSFKIAAVGYSWNRTIVLFVFSPV